MDAYYYVMKRIAHFVTEGSWQNGLRQHWESRFQKWNRQRGPAPEWHTVDLRKFRSDVEALLLKCGKHPIAGYRLNQKLI